MIANKKGAFVGIILFLLFGLIAYSIYMWIIAKDELSIIFLGAMTIVILSIVLLEVISRYYPNSKIVNWIDNSILSILEGFQ